MNKEHYKRFFCDIIAAALSWVVFFYYRKTYIEGGVFEISPMLIYGIIGVTIFWSILYIFSGNYIDIKRVSRLNELYKTTIQSAIGSITIFFLIIIDDIENYTEYTLYYKAILGLFSIHFLITFSIRYYLTNSMVKKIQNGKVGFRTLLIGDTKNIQNVFQEITSRHKSSGNQFIGYLHSENKKIDDFQLQSIGKIQDVESVIVNQKIEEVILAFEKNKLKKHNYIFNTLIYHDIVTKVTSDIADVIAGRVKMHSFFDLPFVEIKQIKMSFLESSLKRFLDIVISTIALTILTPLLIAIAIAVKLSSRGNIFYLQERLGYKKRPFYIIKFRSMYVNSEKKTPLLASENDQRITKWGKIMRKYRLDELPQFYNVLIGEMSIIGPRPERSFFADKILKKAPHYKLVHKVKPGITSWGMVKFGYAENVEEMILRLKYDMIYLENLSLLNDFKVFIFTIFIILQGRGK